MSESQTPTRPRAILFDMDGTLTRPLLDFALIRSDIGVPAGAPILEFIAGLPAPGRARATAILEPHEEQAAEHSTLNEGAREILHWCVERRIGTALVTRNSRRSAATVMRLHGLSLDCVIAREDGPIKPDPRALCGACERLGIATSDAWMIGDGRHDIEAAAAANIRSVWISHRTERTFDAAPWKTVSDLGELKRLLESCRAVFSESEARL